MIIEKLTINDIDQIENIEKECFIDPWPKEAFVRELTNDISAFYVLKDEDNIIGYYGLWYMFENADLVNIAIAKSYQGNKYGELLLNDAINRCKEKNVEFLHLEVRVDNNVAINLYKKYDFVEVRKRKGYYNGADGIDMVKGLI